MGGGGMAMMSSDEQVQREVRAVSRLARIDVKFCVLEEVRTA